MAKNYVVKRISGSITMDADWDKPAWAGIEPAPINIPHWPVQTAHLPKTEVKMQYDANHIYVIFRVQDRYVRAVAEGYGGKVCKDSCVEFFFSPYSRQGTSYFNLEVNCCGVPLMHYHPKPHDQSSALSQEDYRQIQIAASVPGPVRTENAKPLTWVLEYALPFEILGHYADYEKPAPGLTWHGNFYKCADDSSHPHWLAWSPVVSEKPDFHRPQDFGALIFR